jgi:hypothetical protein
VEDPRQDAIPSIKVVTAFEERTGRSFISYDSAAHDNNDDIIYDIIVVMM